MIHQQEKLELLQQQVEVSTNLMDNKILSREWIYENIFDFSDADKKKIFDGIIEDRKQAFRFEQLEVEGNDPVESGEKVDSEEDASLEMARRDEWGGDRRTGTAKKESDTGFKSKDLKDATAYHRERYGKREFKGGSPLYPGKGGTIVAREGLLDLLKQKFGKSIKSQSILSEEVILDEEN